jgi:glycosyltransferase involved in cell wall biosynthesis
MQSNINSTTPLPQFSVVIPLYNKRPYIRRAVESVLGQTNTDFELIVIDDGSVDGSSEAISDIKDPRLKIVPQSNQGEGPARNAGMRAARGQLIAFLDADDAWFPPHLTELWDLSEAFPDAGLLATTFLENGDETLPDDPLPHKTRRRQVDYFREAAKRIGLVWSGTAAIKRDVFEAVGGFTNARAGADLEYWARVALSYPVAVSDRVTAVYFRGTGGVMETLAREASANKTINLPARLREISPSVAMLCDRIEQHPELAGNDSIRHYINGRLTMGIPGAIYQGAFAAARHAFTLTIPPLTYQQHFYRLVAHLPEAILIMASNGYRRLKVF